MQHSSSPAGYTKSLLYVAGNQCFVHSSQSRKKNSSTKLAGVQRKTQNQCKGKHISRGKKLNRLTGALEGNFDEGAEVPLDVGRKVGEEVVGLVD